MQQFIGSNVVYIRRSNSTSGMTEIAYYDGKTERVDKTPDQLLNETLHMVNSSLTASRESMKIVMKYSHYPPVVIDASQNFVFFPLHKRQSYEMCYINNQHFLQAIDFEDTIIYFTNGRSLIVPDKADQIEKHQLKAIKATDYFTKLKKRFL
ncbi:hypothetical protein ERX37_04715 [Macrococcus hajekii]|uniref:Competence protein ComK n=1 Tax=Macrococcus hajekii TaxID=198482 RepID=A0A4R6BNF9_9STAP|nr:competence protein ComK [Macrococcus hajekii]TDM03390.1 hypothetical protein ERX37_04715 [Macrococcus hajekii]GGA98456.1 hypothetical protein GCM10007190_03090 [Macrococcus hajekii]